MNATLFEVGKTAYSIIDERGDKSTITIEKWEADLLQEILTDVHKWLQEIYSRVCEKSYFYLVGERAT